MNKLGQENRKYNIQKQNFISADFRTARNSYEDFFTIGDIIIHEDEDAGEATIINFSMDIPSNEIIVNTDKGWAHIDFIDHVAK